MRRQEETMKTGEIRWRFEQNKDVAQMGIFSSSTFIVNDLMVGYQGNIASKYSKSREDIKNVSEDLLFYIN